MSVSQVSIRRGVVMGPIVAVLRTLPGMPSVSSRPAPTSSRVRPADPGDVPVILALVRELAEYEKALEQVEASEEPADEKLRGIVKILLRTWRNDPDLVTVMVREVGRSAQLATQVEVIGQGFAVIERVIREGQAEGVFRPGLDPQLASWVVYGGLEEILTGWVMGRLPDGDEEVARAERTIVDVVLGGLGETTVVV
jgi:AcrR family transcriptional regulator